MYVCIRASATIIHSWLVYSSMLKLGLAQTVFFFHRKAAQVQVKLLYACVLSELGIRYYPVTTYISFWPYQNRVFLSFYRALTETE